MTECFTDDYLTDEQYKFYGLTPESGRDLWMWILQRIGYVLDRKGVRGSGVTVKKPEGGFALLTANHVAISAILTGEIHTAIYRDRQGHCKPAASIRFSRHCDVALLSLRNEQEPAHYLEVDEWEPSADIEVDLDSYAIAGGLPALWKGAVDLDRRIIRCPKTMLLWTGVKDIGAGSIRVQADERVGDLPKTLRGMSGGPLFTLDKKLIGVIEKEHRNDSTRKLRALSSTRRCKWMDLYYPHGLSEHLDSMTPCERMECEFIAAYIPFSKRALKIRLSADYYRIQTDLDQNFRSCYRFDEMRFLDTEGSSYLPVNIELVVPFLGEDEAVRYQEFEEEARSLLREMEFRLVERA